jgi:transposase-like protein
MEKGLTRKRVNFPWYVVYNESFRIKVVREVEEGKISKEAVRRKYGIGGKSTVLYWCRKYGREDYPYMPDKAQKRVLGTDEKDQRIVELEKQLKKAQTAIDALESLIEVANEMYGTDLKKKVGTRRSKK